MCGLILYRTNISILITRIYLYHYCIYWMLRDLSNIQNFITPKPCRKMFEGCFKSFLDQINGQIHVGPDNDLSQVYQHFTHSVSSLLCVCSQKVICDGQSMDLWSGVFLGIHRKRSDEVCHRTVKDADQSTHGQTSGTCHKPTAKLQVRFINPVQAESSLSSRRGL